MRLAVAGATGRMGRCVLELASRDERFRIAAALTGPGCPMSEAALRVGSSEIPIVERFEADCDVLVDFSLPEGTMAWLDVCRRGKTPMIIGVTGHDDAQSARIREVSDDIPIVLAANFSVGMNAVLGLLRPLLGMIGSGYDIEIVETHHRHKADAPSGTALAIVHEIRRAADPNREREGTGQPSRERERPVSLPPCQGGTQGGSNQNRDRVGAEQSVASPLVTGASIVFGRQGPTGERPVGQIGVHAVRMGEVVGQHEIHFSGCGETITIRHTAHSRDTFAAGALRAAAWVVGRSAGLYSMRDVLEAL